MAAILIIGCTIMIGLSEWHDRKEIECRNTELHEWRKDMHDLNMHIAEMSLLGETVADWDTTDVEVYHQLRMEVDCMLLDMGKMNRQIEAENLRQLFVEKERLLLQIRNAVQKRNDIHEKLTTEVPKIVAKSKKEQQVQSFIPRSETQKKKRRFWARLFGKEEKAAVDTVKRQQPTATTQMLSVLNQKIVARHQQQSRKVNGHLDSLGIRNEAINHHLQKMIAVVDEHVNKGIVEREQQIATLEGNYTYYYIGMLSLLILVLFCMFLQVIRNKKRTDQLIGKLNAKNQQNIELLTQRRQTIQAITHELRIPLATLKHHLGVMKKDSADEIDISLEAVAGMEQMLNDLLDYFRLDNGKETIMTKPFTIKGLGTRLASEFAGLADKKGLVLTVESSSDDIVLGDKEKIQRIVRNLLSNALKFTDAGSVTLRLSYEGGMLFISVHDTGTGMDEEEQQQIFDAFRQLSNAATKDGFGLGLSIVKNLVGMMNGKIELSSKKNVGSTITVEIPLPLVHEKDIERENEIIGDNRAEVVVIDDNELILHRMQGANGYDVLKILRMSNIGNSRTIPVVAVTESAGITEDYLTGKGFSGCLSKPFSPNELMAVANRFIQKDVNGKGNIDLIPLYEFGEKQRTLWLFEEETEENIRRIDKAWEKGDRHELKEILHSMRGTWELIGCGEKLNRVFSSVKNTTTTDKEIAQGICEIKRQCEDIIQAIHEEQEGGMK